LVHGTWYSHSLALRLLWQDGTSSYFGTLATSFYAIIFTVFWQTTSFYESTFTVFWQATNYSDCYDRRRVYENIFIHFWQMTSLTLQLEWHSFTLEWHLFHCRILQFWKWYPGARHLVQTVISMPYCLESSASLGALLGILHTRTLHMQPEQFSDNHQRQKLV